MVNEFQFQNLFHCNINLLWAPELGQWFQSVANWNTCIMFVQSVQRSFPNITTNLQKFTSINCWYFSWRWSGNQYLYLKGGAIIKKSARTRTYGRGPGTKHTYARARTCARAHTHTHTYIHTHNAHARTHTHTHTLAKITNNYEFRCLRVIWLRSGDTTWQE